MNKNSNENKIALVTGANRGIGKAIAEGLAARGCKVYLGVRNEGSSDEIISKILKSGGNAVELVLDVSSDESVRKAHSIFGC
jgi:NAD(P)-dependent dehydrogenase (short-subunit alcohol dehydrogenase family)